MKAIKIFTLLLAGSLLTSCGEDFLDEMSSSTVTPDQIAEIAKEDPDKVLSSQLKGCYMNWNELSGMSRGDINDHMSVGFGGIMMLSDAMSNDLSLSLGSGDPWHYDHILDYNAAQYVRPAWPWKFFYTVIKSANDLINVVDESTANEGMKHILGQAYAFRGISHAYLAQFYQKTYADSKDKLCVPIRLSNNEESILGRATVEQVYAQAEADLLKAVDYLEGYERANKASLDQSVAQGLLSRVYLVMNKWQEAADMAKAARTNYTLNDIDDAYNWNYQDADNQEVMWAFIPSESNKKYYASWASWHSIDGPGYGGVEVGAIQLIDAALYKSMPDTDIRKQLYVAPGEEVAVANGIAPEYANLKFPFVANWLGNVVYMRVSEMYLNEAEGLLMAGKSAEAAAVMAEFMPNRIEGWTAPAGYTQESIYKQRRTELWGEGFGFFDCCRLRQDLIRKYEGTNEPVATQVNIPYTSYKWIYQIPQSEINDNEEIGEEDQNPLD